ncbi:MAG: 16S rRNA processing protein RimM [Micavibrio aeruginosavorus]|uniref:Ribosome maturation factor RimM n=1 Tax=Micavibrio aeruginosavorus TaxID=349221 RepID=A0A2W4ZZR8_9BACT|nr:MAG: 16S rRNA processing protein RimM [Micavibrio aeruginosavorus]
MNEKRIQIGEIATAHGIKGFVKLRSFVDDDSLFEDGTVFTSETGAKTLSFKIRGAVKKDLLAEVTGVSDRNGAEALRGTKLYIDRDALPETDDGEYYIEDLKGLTVVDRQGNDIGTILSVENFGASDLLDIKPQSGQSFYIPFTDETVLEVDFDAGKVTVELPETL